TDCWSATNVTIPSHASILTATSPRDTGVIDNLVRLSDFFFRQESGLRIHPLVSLAVAGLVMAWSVWTLNRRIRPVEVVI
ncbi:MAG: hypothetical protein O7F11_04215, partial [Acidobacteria bacterium]|nr:hypothetical protein [Acidobacteriota bacterium]